MKNRNRKRVSVESLEDRKMLTATTISTPAGVAVDGGVEMLVNEVGSFGEAWEPEEFLQASYNPNGSATAADADPLAVYESGLAIGRTGSTSFRFLDELADNRQFVTETNSVAISQFTLSKCDLGFPPSGDVDPCYTSFDPPVVDVTLTQTVTPVFESTGARSGSLLTQSYEFTNRIATDIPIDGVRYLDLHLAYESDEYQHGGGRLGSGELFEIDRRTESTQTNDELAFGALLNVEHDQDVNNAFAVDEWNELSGVLTGSQLNNQVQEDSGNDGDLLIDQDSGNLDPTLWMRHGFDIPASQSVTYETRLFFGSDKPTDASVRDVQVDHNNRTVSIEFTDEVDVESSDLIVFHDNGQEFNAVSFEYDILSSTATWEFNVNFEPHNFRLSDDITDLSGNAINPLGDMDGDGTVTADDIDLLFAAIDNSSTDDEFDINGDGNVDQTDVDYLVEVVLQTKRGDVDLDGTVGFSDFLTLSANFGTQGGWADGDVDGSGIVDFADFLLLSSNFGS